MAASLFISLAHVCVLSCMGDTPNPGVGGGSPPNPPLGLPAAFQRSPSAFGDSAPDGEPHGEHFKDKNAPPSSSFYSVSGDNLTTALSRTLSQHHLL